MLRAGVGISQGKRGRGAAFEAASRAMARAGGEKAQLCFCFATPDHHGELPTVLAAVREITQAPHVVGCAGAGILTGDGEIEGESAVGVLCAGGELSARPFLLRDLDAADEWRELGSRMREARGDVLVTLLG